MIRLPRAMLRTLSLIAYWDGAKRALEQGDYEREDLIHAIKSHLKAGLDIRDCPEFERWLAPNATIRKTAA